MLVLLVTLVLAGVSTLAIPGGAAAAPPAALANRCVALQSAAGRDYVAVAGADAYRAGAPSRARAAAFHLKPTGLGTYLLHDRRGRLLSAPAAGAEARTVTGAAVTGARSEWAARRVSGRWLTLSSTAGAGRLAVAGRGELLVTREEAGAPSRLFALVAARGCRRFPEAGAGAFGRPFAGRAADGSVLGFADLHLHLTADMRAGGRVIHGRAFDRFGIARALGGDERDHGPDGSMDVTGNLLRTGLPFGTHDTSGWPGFRGWPVHDTNTHQQVYWVWLERAWKAGLRLVVAQAVEDEPLCRIQPRRSHSCDETATIELQIRRLRRLQDYVDAQSGGRGRGWFRLVYGPHRARRVIERGKLAVVIGVESSNPFGCSRTGAVPRCSRTDVDRGVARFHRWGVRSLFVAHWVDNAFAGAALEGGAKGVFINVFNRFQTGRYFRTGRCPRPGQGEEMRTLSAVELNVLAQFYPATRALAEEGMPAYPPGRRCNRRGLSALGGHLVRRLMAERMMIEADHLSEPARKRLLAIAARHRYPLVSSHNGTGGAWTPAELGRLYRLGGIAGATLDTAPRLSRRILRLARRARRVPRSGVALGTDTGGFSSLPGPTAVSRLRYPFRSADGRVRFVRQRSGRRVYDLNRDGMAHYGLLADLLGELRGPTGRRAQRVLFRSAEAYLRAWEQAARHAPRNG